jgi:hypothetical protein
MRESTVDNILESNSEAQNIHNALYILTEAMYVDGITQEAIDILVDKYYDLREDLRDLSYSEWMDWLTEYGPERKAK